jgi:hypothetical protein
VHSSVFQHDDVVRCLTQSRVHEPIKKNMIYVIKICMELINVR